MWPQAAVEHVPAEAAIVAQRLHTGKYDAVVARPEILTALLERFQWDELILQHIDKGLAVLDPEGRILWANPTLRLYTHGDPVGRPLLEALQARVAAVGYFLDPQRPVETDWHTPSASRLEDPLGPARQGRSVHLRLYCPTCGDQPYLEADIRPVLGPDGQVTQLIALIRNVTSEISQQQKLDALHQAGRELAGLSPEQLAEMDVRSRIELLKQNLRHCIHDLLHYDTIEVRLLDRKTGELVPLLQDGMLPEAAHRKLYARPTGNGVTGYVAYTGRSYLCPDTTKDPLYLQGAPGARSSMTVPLKFHDEVIGTLNVESPRVNGFGPEDLQFTELFSKEIAAALHTLDLLSAQQICTASQSIDAVNKEIALPLDEVVAGTSVLLEQFQPTHPDVAERLRKMRAAARAVKEGVASVGKNLLVGPLSPSNEAPLRGRRFLVIDSDEQMRRQAHLVLSRLGAIVETASRATDGLAMAASSEYDAILQEVKPPDLGGYDCYRRLRAVAPRALIAMTTGFGYDTAHSIIKARADGMKHVLYKPFRQDQILQLLPDLPPPATPEPVSSSSVTSTDSVTSTASSVTSTASSVTSPLSPASSTNETSMTASTALSATNPNHTPTMSSVETPSSPTVVVPPN
jgi:GAF domain-containing protein/ActR/RegA family two-component response regulator